MRLPRLVACALSLQFAATAAWAQPAPDPLPPPDERPPGEISEPEPAAEPSPDSIPFEPVAPDGLTEPSVKAETETEEAVVPETPLDVQARQLILSRFPGYADAITVTEEPRGTLTIQGEVTSLSAKLSIGESLAALPESAIVINMLAAEPPKRSDAAIARNVRGLLREDEILGRYAIRVSVRRQTVYLSGSVPAPLTAQQALEQAAKVRGVRDVNIANLRSPDNP